MICTLISDTHNQLHKLKLPGGDILFHAGDLCGKGSENEMDVELQKLADLKKLYTHIVFCAGNHDWYAQLHPEEMRAKATELGLIYLQDKEVTINGVRVYGSPWQPEFCNWAFNLPRGAALKEKWDMIPNGIDVLLTHSPPFGICDKLDEWGSAPGTHVGCEELLVAVKRIRPQFHLFGHIHCEYGTTREEGIIFMNGSTCTERYKPKNPPIEFAVGAW